MSRFANLEFEGKERKQAESAAKQAQSAPDQSRNDAFYLGEADKLFRAGKFEKALRSYSRALEINHGAFEGWFGQVRMLIEMDELPEANLWADKALEKFKDHPKLISAKAVAQGRMSNLDKAMAFSDAAIKSQGSDAYLWLARGEVLLASGHKNHEHCFWKSTQEEPSDWFIYLCVGRSYRYHRQFALALRHLQKGLELQTGEPFLWCEHGYCQLGIAMQAAAIRSFSRALELDKLCEEAKQGIAAAKEITFFDRVRRFFIDLLGN